MLDGDGGGVEAVLADDGQLAPGLALDADHLIAGGEGDLHGLFDDDVFPRLHGADGMLGVITRRRAEADDIDVGVGGHVLVGVMNPGDADLGGEVAGTLGDEVGDGGDDGVAVVDAHERAGVGGADAAATDNAESKLPTITMVGVHAYQDRPTRI